MRGGLRTMWIRLCWWTRCGLGRCIQYCPYHRNFERAGVAAVHIEDQVAQKRCGHRPNKAIVSKDEMVDRIKAAVDARRLMRTR